MFEARACADCGRQVGAAEALVSERSTGAVRCWKCREKRYGRSRDAENGRGRQREGREAHKKQKGRGATVESSPLPHSPVPRRGQHYAFY